MTTSKPSEGVVPPADIVEAVRRLVAESSEQAVAERFGMGRNAVSRLRAGAPVRQGTIALARQALGLAAN